MNPTDNEKKILNDVCAVAGLFILVPIGYLIQLYSIYLFIAKNEKIITGKIGSDIGLVLMFLIPPILHWISYKYCKESFGWFKKK